MLFINDQYWTLWAVVVTLLVVVAAPFITIHYCRRHQAFKQLLDKHKKELLTPLLMNKNCKGLAVVIGVGTSSVAGVKKDVESMKKAFESLGFAVLSKVDMDRRDLRALIRAVATYEYDPTVKVIAFYMSGHGKKSFWCRTQGFVTGDSKLLNLDKDLFSQFYTSELRNIKRLFFLDICRGPKMENVRWLNSNSLNLLLRRASTWLCSSKSTMPILSHLVPAIPVQGNCLIAYSGIDGYAVGGDDNGGFWTQMLKDRIVENKEIFLVLAETWEATIQLTTRENLNSQGNEDVVSLQGPSLYACIGHLNLITETCSLSDSATGTSPEVIESQTPHGTPTQSRNRNGTSPSTNACSPPLSDNETCSFIDLSDSATGTSPEVIGSQTPHGTPTQSRNCNGTSPSTYASSPSLSDNGLNSPSGQDSLTVKIKYSGGCTNRDRLKKEMTGARNWKKVAGKQLTFKKYGTSNTEFPESDKEELKMYLRNYINTKDEGADVVVSFT